MEKKYNIGCYVATVAPIYINKKGEKVIASESEFKIIVEKSSGPYYDDSYTDIITNKVYFKSYKFEKKYNCNYFITNLTPLEIDFPNQTLISESELIEYLDKLNNRKTTEFIYGNSIDLNSEQKMHFARVLWVARIVPITEKKKGVINEVTEKSEWVVVSGYSYSSVYNNAKTRMEYRCVYHYDYETLKNSLGEYFIAELRPIEKYYPNKEYISELEIDKLSDGLNDRKTNYELKNSKFDNGITDGMLKAILKSKRIISISNISDETKEKLIGKLYELGNEYIENLITYKEKCGMLDYQSYKYELINKCVSILADIEFFIVEYNISGYDCNKLETQLDKFKKQFQ